MVFIVFIVMAYIVMALFSYGLLKSFPGRQVDCPTCEAVIPYIVMTACTVMAYMIMTCIAMTDIVKAH